MKLIVTICFYKVVLIFFCIHAVYVLMALCPSPVNCRQCCSNSRVSSRNARRGWTSCLRQNRSWLLRSQGTMRACWNSRETTRLEKHETYMCTNSCLCMLSVVIIIVMCSCSCSRPRCLVGSRFFTRSSVTAIICWIRGKWMTGEHTLQRAFYFSHKKASSCEELTHCVTLMSHSTETTSV